MYLDISDGTTTVVLSGTAPVRGCTYFPATAQMSGGAWQAVTESAEVNLTGTAAAVRAAVNTIEKLLQAAALRQQTGAGARVFVNYKPVDGDSVAYRSELLDGRVVWSTNPGLRHLEWTTPTVQIAVIWTRAHWWEGAEVELPLLANAQASATGGRTINSDPSIGNWVQIDAAQVVGALPAPLRVQLTNTSGGSLNYRKLFMAVNAESDPANLVNFLQGEARLSGGTTVADATASGGNVLGFVVTASPTTFAWTLPAADMQRTKGRRFRILARFVGTSGQLYVTPQYRTGTGVVLWQGDELALGTVYESWQDLGVMPLPPGGFGTPYAAGQLALVMRGASVGELDIIQLTPLDSYRYLELPATGVAVANNGAIVHDGTEGLLYALVSSVRTPLPSSFGAPLMLKPDKPHRIQFLAQIYTGLTAGEGEAPIAPTFSARLYYRPRRLTV